MEENEIAEAWEVWLSSEWDRATLRKALGAGLVLVSDIYDAFEAGFKAAEKGA